MARREKSLIAFLDTHIVCWLYAGRVELLSQAAIDAIEQRHLYISPIVLLELTYLREIGRINRSALEVVQALQQDIGLEVQEVALSALVFQAQSLSWTRDPFDRMIVAQAAMHEYGLITKDSLIKEHYLNVIWD